MRTPPTNARVASNVAEARRESTERRILESAVALLCDGVAWHQLGIRQIAERAEISRTAFYDFFASKHDVIEQLVRGLHDDLAHLLADAVDGTEERPPCAVLRAGRLRGVLRQVADFNAEHGPIYRAFLDATTESTRLDGMWDDLSAVYAGFIVRAIDDARARYASAPNEPSSVALASVLLVMTERTMLLILRDSPSAASRQELLEALVQVWERSVFGTAHPAAPLST